MTQKLNKRIKFLSVLALVSIIFLLFARVSNASTEVYFQKDSKQIMQGDTFSTKLEISSDQIVNAVDGTITYDKEKLAIKEVKIDNSQLSLWVEKPVFDNGTGELSFVGGLPNGFSGKDETILEIVFLAKKNGSALVGFKDIFSVFANDEKGTMINPWLKPTSFLINKNPNLLFAWGVLILGLLFVVIGLFLKNKKNDKIS